MRQLFKVGDLIEVIANIDYQGLEGIITEIVKGEHIYKVKFNEQLWCCYSEGEIKLSC